MKKVVSILTIILILSFTSKNNIVTETIDMSDIVTSDIATFEEIIKEKLEIAQELESRASAIKNEENAVEKKELLLKEAKLQKSMVLKYKAAITCRINFAKK